MAGLGINGIVLGWLIGDLVLLATLTPQVARLADFTKQSLKPTKQGYLPLLRFAFPLFLASAVMFLYTWYDQALILAFLPNSDLGIYNTAYRVFSVLVSVAIAMGLALLPYYGMAHGRNDHKAISYGITRASKYTMLLIFPLSLGLMALPPVAAVSAVNVKLYDVRSS